jgi:glycosyltransferase involved in cell wall biosynthesis
LLIYLTGASITTLFATALATSVTRQWISQKFVMLKVRYGKQKDMQNESIPNVSIGTPEGNGSLKPLITTIIPTYRRPKLLRRAIKSVLNQTYPHFQVCVYDNASGDETAEVVAELAKEDSRVKYHCHGENIGAINNFIYGMEHVDTPFFSLLSDDDILLPEFYETALAGFKKYPEAIFSATLTIVADEQGNILSVPDIRWKPGLYLAPDGLVSMLKCGDLVWTGIIFRREIIKKVGIFNQTMHLADVDFKLRAAAHFPFVVSTESGAIFVSHPSSSTVNIRLYMIWPHWLKMINNLKEDEQIPLDVRLYAEYTLTKHIKKIIFFIAVQSILQKDYEESFKAINILRNHYRQKVIAFSLSATAMACKYFPPVSYFLNFVNNFRKIFKKFLQRNEQPDLQKRFGSYAQFLKY